MRCSVAVFLNNNDEGYWSKKGTEETTFLRAEVLADILDGCNAQCPGCHVPKKNKPSSLKTLYETLAGSSFKVDELIIGPTDIFDATNFNALVTDPYLAKLYAFTSIGYVSAMTQDVDTIAHKLRQLRGVYPNPDIEFKLVLTISDLINDTMPDDKLALFTEGSVQFKINYYKGMFDQISYNDICDIVLARYNAPVTVAPSFLNNSNLTGRVSDQLRAFKRDLVEQDIKPEYRDWYPMFDPDFNAYGCASYSFFNNQLYSSPFIFDAIPQRNGRFLVDDINRCTLSDNLRVNPCGSCEYLMSCAERGVHVYMDTRGLTECVLPKEYMHGNNQE